MDSGLPRCTEHTVVVIITLPPGRDWAWLGDCNVLALSDRLNEAGRQAALVEVGAAWRRSFLYVVGEQSNEVTQLPGVQRPAAS